MPLSRQQVEHIARLARLKLTPEEIDKYTVELTVVVDYIDQLQTVDTDGVGMRSGRAGDSVPLRDDAVAPSLPRDEVLRNAPRHTEEFILVPKVLGG